MKKIIVTASLLSLSAASFAQSSSTANQNVSLSLSNVIAITFTSSGSGTGSAVSLPFTTVANYTNGVTSSTQTLKVQSNKAFNVTVAANASNFTYSGSTSPAPSMPVSDLNLQVVSNTTGGTVAGTFGSSFTDLSHSSQNLITGGAAGSNQAFGIQYEATPGFSYPAGTYTTNIVYTATQP